MKFLNSLNNLFVQHTLWGGFLFCLLFAVFPDQTRAQGFEKIKEWKHINGFAGADHLGNIYSLEAAELKKILPDGTELSYSNPVFGHPGFVDVSDPLNVLLFFQEFGALVVLDRSLAVKSIFKDTAWDDQFGFPSLVAFSSLNGFWAWFPDQFLLSRYDLRGNKAISGTDMLAQHPNIGTPSFMLEQGEKLFLAANGIWVFDLFATLLFHIPHINTQSFWVRDNRIFYISGNNLYIYDFVLEQENVILLPEERVISFFVQNYRLIFLQTNVSLKKFSSVENLY